MSPGPRLPPGQRFGAYLVDACVGEGGMGAVYRATDTKLGRRVALKVIRPDAAGATSADAIARFLREARVGAALAHPNIVVVFEAGAIGDTPYLSMEWVDGASLADLMDRGPAALPPSQRLDILEAVVDALSHAHGRGVIHRDVKPTNVMIDERGRARLVDFGIAKRIDPLAVGTQMLPTHARALLGTPAYMAPEQMLSPAVDARADQFSWGVMAYELLGGSHPNETVPPDGPPFPVAKAQPLGWLRPDVPEAVAAVVHRAMTYEPGGRFGSMDELLYAFRSARAMGASANASTPPPYVPAYGSPNVSAYGATANAAQGHAHGYGPPPGHGARHEVSTVARQDGTLAPHGGGHAAYGAHGSHGVHASTPMRAVTHAPPGQHSPGARGFPWLAVVGVVGALVMVLAGVGITLALTGHAPTALPGGGGSPITSPISIGAARSATVDPFDQLKFAGPPAEVTKAKSAIESKLGSCWVGVPSGLMFSLEILVTADGRITKVQEAMVCKRQFGEHYLCTDREDLAKPKQDHPVVPDAVFACIDRTFTGTRLPRVTVDPGEATMKQDVHVYAK